MTNEQWKMNNEQCHDHYDPKIFGACLMENEDGRGSLPASATFRRGLWRIGVQTEDSVSDRPRDRGIIARLRPRDP